MDHGNSSTTPKIKGNETIATSDNGHCWETQTPPLESTIRARHLMKVMIPNNTIIHGAGGNDDDCAGRSMVASRDIRAGQLVYESPRGQSLKTVDLAFGTRVCLNCGDNCGDDTAPAAGEYHHDAMEDDIDKVAEEDHAYQEERMQQPLQCRSCEAASWCSHECRSADSELHAMTCRFVRPLLRELRCQHGAFVENRHTYHPSPDSSSSSTADKEQATQQQEQQQQQQQQEPIEWTEGINLLTILAIVCLRAQHLTLDGCSNQTSVPPNLYQGIQGMVSNQSKWPKGTRHMTLVQLWHTCLTSALPHSWVPPVEELAALTSALNCNVFSMWTSAFGSYGSVIEPWAALLNHSCTPNMARIEAPPTSYADGSGSGGMRFIAICDINAGDPVCFSYLPSDATFEERRDATFAEYCFRCDCARCE